MSSGPVTRLVKKTKLALARKPVLSGILLFAVSFATITLGQSAPHDPGVRGGTVNAGQPLASLSQTPGASSFFANGLLRFQEIESVQNGANNGLGPRFNSNQCASCHAQPAIGGTSPSTSVFPNIGPNPETLVYTLDGAQNTLPSFISPAGPVREARFKFFLNSNGGLSSTPDGGVHALFVISGRSDAGTCAIQQPNFANNLSLNNVIFRIPTPLFGAGLIENISEETIYANMNASAQQKQSLGISGHPNRDGNDNMIARFGWKAQNKSLEMFAGEAYNVEMGVSNELFTNERSAVSGCVFNGSPEDATNIVDPTDGSTTGTASNMSSDVVNFAAFIRLSAPAAPVPLSASAQTGQTLFGSVGCAMCHTATLQSGPSPFTGMSNVVYHPYSDFALHHMGSNLADGVVQGNAGPDMFRTAPLWGIGQRLFFLHDGRTADLLQAIEAHFSSGNVCTDARSTLEFEVSGSSFEPSSQSQVCGSEANAVINKFNSLTPAQKQAILNFLRSL